MRDKIRSRIAPSFDPTTSRNRLVMRLISSPEPDRGEMKGGTYLPYKTHPAFDRMAEDVAAILSLNLPDQDAFQYLQPLLGLHLYLYGIETAFAWLGNQGLPPIVCEILAPRNDLVRKAAVGSYLHNDGIGELAVRKFIDTRVLSDPELNKILSDGTLDDVAKTDYLAEHLMRTVSLKKKPDTTDPRKMTELFQRIRQEAVPVRHSGWTHGPCHGLWPGFQARYEALPLRSDGRFAPGAGTGERNRSG